MNDKPLINKLLDGHIDMKENIAKITEIVERHDKVTFPEMKADIKNTNNAVTRMESKQNEDMVRFMSEKERLSRRLEPLEADLEKRVSATKINRGRIANIFWGGIEKVIYIVIGSGTTLWLALKTKYFE